MKAPQKILIIQTAFIGDVVLTTPLIRAIKQKWPQALLDVLVIPQTREVLQNNPHIHALLTFDKRADKRRAFRETARRLAANAYDVCFLPHRSLTSARLALCGKIPRRFGFAGHLAGLLYTQRFPFDRSKIQIRRYLDLLPDSPPEDIQTELFFSDSVKQKALDVLRPLDRFSTKIAIAPGSVWPTKMWPRDYYASLMKLLEKHHIGMALVGSAAERKLCDYVSIGIDKQKVVNLAGKTSLLQAAAVIQACDLLVCNDSGAMHLANAVQTDVFAFFGPTVTDFGFAPFRVNDRVFEYDIECRPCSSHGGVKCPQGHFKCMLNIEAISVYREIIKVFGLAE